MNSLCTMVTVLAAIVFIGSIGATSLQQQVFVSAIMLEGQTGLNNNDTEDTGETPSEPEASDVISAENNSDTENISENLLITKYDKKQQPGNFSNIVLDKPLNFTNATNYLGIYDTIQTILKSITDSGLGKTNFTTSKDGIYYETIIDPDNPEAPVVITVENNSDTDGSQRIFCGLNMNCSNDLLLKSLEGSPEWLEECERQMKC